MSRSRWEEVRIVERSRIVLACLEGKQIKDVARELGTSVLTVSKWRRRFAASGVNGLLDLPRPGKPPTYGADFRGRVLSLAGTAAADGFGAVGRPRGGRYSGRKRACRLASATTGRNLSAATPHVVREH